MEPISEYISHRRSAAKITNFPMLGSRKGFAYILRAPGIEKRLFAEPEELSLEMVQGALYAFNQLSQLGPASHRVIEISSTSLVKVQFDDICVWVHATWENWCLYNVSKSMRTFTGEEQFEEKLPQMLKSIK